MALGAAILLAAFQCSGGYGGNEGPAAFEQCSDGPTRGTTHCNCTAFAFRVASSIDVHSYVVLFVHSSCVISLVQLRSLTPAVSLVLDAVSGDDGHCGAGLPIPCRSLAKVASLISSVGPVSIHVAVRNGSYASCNISLSNATSVEFEANCTNGTAPGSDSCIVDFDCRGCSACITTPTTGTPLIVTGIRLRDSTKVAILYSGYLTVTNVTFTGHTGSVLVRATAGVTSPIVTEVLCQGCVIADNALSGSIIRQLYGSVSLKDSVIRDCTSNASNSPLISVTPHWDATRVDNTALFLANNTQFLRLTQHLSAVISLLSVATITFSGSIVADCFGRHTVQVTQQSDSQPSVLQLSQSRFERNTPFDIASGGAFSLNSPGVALTLMATDTSFISNVARSGAVLVGPLDAPYTLRFTACTFRNNQASTHGGGISINVGLPSLTAEHTPRGNGICVSHRLDLGWYKYGTQIRTLYLLS